MSCKLEPAIWSRDTGQGITWFRRCQLIITWCHMSKKYTVNQGCMSLHDRRHARLHRRRRRRAYAPTSNTASHDNHEKILLWVSFNSLYGYEASLGGPSSLRSSAIKYKSRIHIENEEISVTSCFRWIYYRPSWHIGTIRSLIRSLINFEIMVIFTMWLALSSAIYLRIALFFALDCMFFSAIENGTVKQNN